MGYYTSTESWSASTCKSLVNEKSVQSQESNEKPVIEVVLNR